VDQPEDHATNIMDNAHASQDTKEDLAVHLEVVDTKQLEITMLLLLNPQLLLTLDLFLLLLEFLVPSVVYF